jgi:putative transposase
MRVSNFSERPIAVLLKPANDGLSVEEACREAGISQQTYDR